MKIETTEDDGDTALSRAAASQWRISRVDIRSPLSRNARYVARVELLHDDRGRVSDVGTGDDTLGAAFAAVTQILGCKASVLRLHSYQRTYPREGDYNVVIATIIVEHDGVRRYGSASGNDLVHACLAAFIDAIGAREEHDGSLSAASLTPGGDLLALRPCQASGLDENGDWWLVASEDSGAAEAIAAEFREEGYQLVRLSLPKDQSR